MKFLLLIVLTIVSSAHAVEIPPGLSDLETVEFLIPHYNEKTGRELNSQIVIWDGLSNMGPSLLAARAAAEILGAFAFATPVFRDVDGIWQMEGVAPGSMSTCFIAFFTDGDILRGRARQTVLAHELYHCYQFQKLGSAGMLAYPGWLTEGGANYVGESVVGGTAAMGAWWASYLHESTSLVLRTYDAFGLFFHLEGRGLDPWRLMEQLMEYNGTSQERFTRLMLLAGNDAIATWTSSIARKPLWGAEWEAVGKDIPPHSTYPAERFNISDESVVIKELEFSRVYHYAVAPRTSGPLRFESRGMTGQIRVVNAEEVVLYEGRFDNLNRLEFCLNDYCGCPSGDESINLIPVPRAARFLITAVGINPTAMGTLTMGKADVHCCEGSRSLDPRLVGTWTIETQPLVENFIPLQFPGQTRGGGGSQTIRIGSNGTISKSTGIHIYTAIPRSPGIRESYASFSISGSFQGCLETTPYPPYVNKFAFNIRGISEGTTTAWSSTYGAARTKQGEDILTKWGPSSDLDNPHSDQQAIGEWISDKKFGIRGTTVRRFNKVGP